MSKPIFWTSSDGKRIINLAAICHCVQRDDGGITVWTNDCTGPNTSIEVRPVDAGGFIAALMPYGVGAP